MLFRSLFHGSPAAEAAPAPRWARDEQHQKDWRPSAPYVIDGTYGLHSKSFLEWHRGDMLDSTGHTIAKGFLAAFNRVGAKVYQEAAPPAELPETAFLERHMEGEGLLPCAPSSFLG